MLATCRCDELFEQAYALFSSKVKPLKSEMETNKRPHATLADDINAPMREGLALYDKQAKRYSKAIAERKREQLLEKLSAFSEELFRMQLMYLQEETFKAFEADFLGCLPPEPTPCPTFAEVSTAAFEKYVALFREKASQSIPSVFPIEWSFELDVDSLKRSMKEVISHQRKEHHNRMMAEIEKRIKVEIIRPITKHLESPDPSLWKRVAATKVDVTASCCHFAEDTLKRSFASSEKEVESLVESIKKLVSTAVFDLLRSKSNMVRYHMDRAFELNFRLDSNELPRRWTPADNVESLFREAVEKSGAILDTLSIARLHGESASIFQDDANDLPDDVILISSDEAKDIYRKFKKEVEADFTKARHEQEQVAARNQLPIIWIILIVIFAFDEIAYILRNPFLILLLLLLGGILFVGWKLNLAPIVVPVVMNAYAQFLGRLGSVLSQFGEQPANIQSSSPPKHKHE
jgi:hypothetical protein